MELTLKNPFIDDDFEDSSEEDEEEEDEDIQFRSFELEEIDTTPERGGFFFTRTFPRKRPD